MHNMRNYQDSVDLESHHDDRSMMQGQMPGPSGLRPSYKAHGLVSDIHAIEQRNLFLENRNEWLTGMLLRNKRTMIARSLIRNKQVVLKDTFKVWVGIMGELKVEHKLQVVTDENAEMQKAARRLAQALNSEQETRKQAENACWQLQDDNKRLTSELQSVMQQSEQQSQQNKVLKSCLKEAETFIARRKEEVMDTAEGYDAIVNTLSQRKKQLEKQDRDNRDSASDRGAPSFRPPYGVEAQGGMTKSLSQDGRINPARRQPSPERERPITGLPSSPMPVNAMPPLMQGQEAPWMRDGAIERVVRPRPYASMQASDSQGRLNWHPDSVDYANSPATGLQASRSYETHGNMQDGRSYETHGNMQDGRSYETHGNMREKVPGSPVVLAPAIHAAPVRTGSPVLPMRTVTVGPPTTAIPTGEPWWAMQRRAAGHIPGPTL